MWQPYAHYGYVGYVKYPTSNLNVSESTTGHIRMFTMWCHYIRRRECKSTIQTGAFVHKQCLDVLTFYSYILRVVKTVCLWFTFVYIFFVKKSLFTVHISLRKELAAVLSVISKDVSHWAWGSSICPEFRGRITDFVWRHVHFRDWDWQYPKSK